MMTANELRILCVDDEPNVLAGLVRHLSLSYEVVTATSGHAAIALIEEQPPFTIVISDMRMPGMDGISFLEKVRQISPNTIRMLLTGNADLTSAIAAVNRGQLFRFLIKPCPYDELINSIEAATKQYQLVMAEHILLEQTLHGSILTLTETLSLASPTAFGRATRVKYRVSELLRHLDMKDIWHIEVAAMLSQVPCVTLPEETMTKFFRGESLTSTELAIVNKLPELSEKIVSLIPRLEPVQQILHYQNKHYDGSGEPNDGVQGEQIPIGSRILKIALDYDLLEGNSSSQVAIDTMRGRLGWYDSYLLDEFGRLLGKASQLNEIKELSLNEVRVGMITACEIKTPKGLIIISRGNEVTERLLDRLRNFGKTLGVREPLQMVIRSTSSKRG